VMHFANFVQTFVMLVLQNVKNFQHTIVVKSVPKLAENVLLSAVKCNQSKSPAVESPCPALMIRSGGRLGTLRRRGKLKN